MSLTCTDGVPATVPGLWISTSCRHCSGPLAEVNGGHAGGCRSLWVGACIDCGRQWMVRADIAAVPSRGAGRHQ